MTHDPLLMNVAFVTYMARDDHLPADGKMVEFWDRIEDQIRKIADEFDLEIDGYRNSVHAFRASIKPNNSGRCVVCNDWISAQNRPNIMQGLGFGAEFQGTLYCMDHLPEESDMFSTFFPFGKNWENFPSDEISESDGFG